MKLPYASPDKYTSRRRWTARPDMSVKRASMPHNFPCQGSLAQCPQTGRAPIVRKITLSRNTRVPPSNAVGVSKNVHCSRAFLSNSLSAGRTKETSSSSLRRHPDTGVPFGRRLAPLSRAHRLPTVFLRVLPAPFAYDVVDNTLPLSVQYVAKKPSICCAIPVFRVVDITGTCVHRNSVIVP